jgi:branched-chain amino acid transport system ATP-binding protein
VTRSVTAERSVGGAADARSPEDVLLEATDLCCARGGAQVLTGFGLTVRRGEAVAVLGANGAGKSTAVDGICGMADRRRGRVLFEGRDISSERPHRIARSGLIQVPQHRDLFPAMTVGENLALGLEALGRRPRNASTADGVLELFPRLKDRRDQIAGSLSGGEQQMVAIARALYGQPKLLLLDEPTAGLAPIVVDALVEVLRTLVDEGVTLVLVEQNVRVALAVCSRFIVLRAGRMVFDGGRSDLGVDARRQLGRFFV